MVKRQAMSNKKQANSIECREKIQEKWNRGAAACWPAWSIRSQGHSSSDRGGRAPCYAKFPITAQKDANGVWEGSGRVRGINAIFLSRWLLPCVRCVSYGTTLACVFLARLAMLRWAHIHIPRVLFVCLFFSRSFLTDILCILFVVQCIACLKRAHYLDPFEWIISYNLGQCSLLTAHCSLLAAVSARRHALLLFLFLFLLLCLFVCLFWCAVVVVSVQLRAGLFSPLISVDWCVAPPSLLVAGLAHMMTGQYASAFHYFSASINLKQVNASWKRTEKHREKESERASERERERKNKTELNWTILAASQGYPNSYMYLAIVLDRLGDFANACNAYDKALELRCIISHMFAVCQWIIRCLAPPLFCNSCVFVPSCLVLKRLRLATCYVSA